MTDKTSDAGSQYRCGQVGGGMEPHPYPLQPHGHSHTQTVIRAGSEMRSFPLFNLNITDGRTNGWTDRQSPL